MDAIDRIMEFVDSVHYQEDNVGDLKKSHVKASVRHTKNGKVVAVREHDDKRKPSEKKLFGSKQVYESGDYIVSERSSEFGHDFVIHEKGGSQYGIAKFDDLKSAKEWVDKKETEKPNVSYQVKLTTGGKTVVVREQKNGK